MVKSVPMVSNTAWNVDGYLAVCSGIDRGGEAAAAVIDQRGDRAVANRDVTSFKTTDDF